jgi:hypothetical protein
MVARFITLREAQKPKNRAKRSGRASTGLGLFVLIPSPVLKDEVSMRVVSSAETRPSLEIASTLHRFAKCQEMGKV